MAEPFLAEIRMMSFNFPPKGWAFCNGQLLPINQNQALFSLLGTTFGGDGRVNFGLPNLQGRVPCHMGNGLTLGEPGGEIAHTLILSEMPQHTHPMQASSSDADVPVAASFVYGGSGAQPCYGAAANLTGLIPGSVTPIGGSQPHLNQQPFTVINFCIALQGIFPSQT
jgi:microcystin-dependent protein